MTSDHDSDNGGTAGSGLDRIASLFASVSVILFFGTIGLPVLLGFGVIEVACDNTLRANCAHHAVIDSITKATLTLGGMLFVALTAGMLLRLAAGAPSLPIPPGKPKLIILAVLFGEGLALGVLVVGWPDLVLGFVETDSLSGTQVAYGFALPTLAIFAAFSLGVGTFIAAARADTQSPVD